jgi:4-hydroxy-tetrahydrodipicolinate reductase
MKIAIVGYGRMGRAVHAEAERRGHQVVATIDLGQPITRETLSGADVAIEFTRAESVPGNLEQLMRLGTPTVTGTTGWSAALPRIEALAHDSGGGLLHGSNFSIGAQLFFRAARELARWLNGRAEFDPQIQEWHHREKLDAPSGTALSLQRIVQAADPSHPYPITSIRQGWDPGTHTLTADSRMETVRLEHSVRDRAVFATGALVAAEWLPGHRGVFTFEDVLFGGSQ